MHLNKINNKFKDLTVKHLLCGQSFRRSLLAEGPDFVIRLRVFTRVPTRPGNPREKWQGIFQAGESREKSHKI